MRIPRRELLFTVAAGSTGMLAWKAAANLSGLACETVVDAAASKVSDNPGYGPVYNKYFTHRVGHGIRIDGHEWQYLVKGNSRPLEPGSQSQPLEQPFARG